MFCDKTAAYELRSSGSCSGDYAWITNMNECHAGGVAVGMKEPNPGDRGDEESSQNIFEQKNVLGCS